MSIAELSDPDAIRLALEEFDELGREAFLNKYGFGASRRFVVEVDGRQYDSKAVAGAAHGFQFPERGPLRHDEFNGGVQTTSRLEDLGFKIINLNPHEPETSSLHVILEQVMDLLALRSTGPEDYDPDELNQLLHGSATEVLGSWAGGRAHPNSGTGVGVAADVPWVGLFPPGGDGSAQRGIYVVYLFAMDGSACFLSLNQGTENVVGGTKVLQKRAADMRRTVHGPADLQTRPDLRSKNNRPTRYESGAAYSIPYERGAVPDDTHLRQDLDQMLGYLETIEKSGLSWHPEIEPLHLLFKWNADREPRTLHIHRELAEAQGATWWGRSAQESTPSVAKGKLAQLERQLDEGLTTHAYLYRRGSLWRATVIEATSDPPSEDDPQFPSYYRPSDCNFYALLKDFEELEPDWAPENLVLASAPDAGPDKLAGGLGNQTTPLFVYELAGAQQPTTRTASDPELTREWLVSETLWPLADIDPLLDELTGPHPQIILAGPPGTGKTWAAKALARYLTDDEPLAWRVVQFHPSYGYEEFIEGIQPTVNADTGAITFKRRDGVVLEMAGQANTYSTQVLIIDEMNRANLPRVLGELMYALEYREEAVDLMYSKGFELPENLRFIGTMNTADRSIRSIDLALRRRFFVYECPPSQEILTQYWAGGQLEVPNLVDGFVDLNQALTEAIDRHHTIGHSFFMPQNRHLTREDLGRVWDHQVAPLIEEYFFDQPELVEDFTLERFWPLT